MTDLTNFKTIVSDSKIMQTRLAERGAELRAQLAAQGFEITDEDVLQSDSLRIFVISGVEDVGDAEAELMKALPQIKKAQEARALAAALADQDSPESVAEARRIANLKPHERMTIARELARDAPSNTPQELTPEERAERLAIVNRQPKSMRIDAARRLGVAE